MLRSLVALIVLTLTFSVPVTAKSLALVIGNNNYENVPTLQKARSDAAGYHALFKQRSFDVTLHTDLTSRGMTVAFATFLDRIEPGDTVVFVFSGHGWSDGRENFLVPTDIQPSGSETLLAHDSFPLRNGVNGIIDEIAKRGAGLTLAIIDACRDNPFAAQGNTRAVGLARGLVPIQAPTGTFVAFSAGAGQTALDRLSDDDNASYSVFTRHFLNEIAKPQDIQAAFKRTQKLVNAEAGRVGHPQRPAYYDEVIGSACLFGNCTESSSTIARTAEPPEPQVSTPTDLHAEAATTWSAFKDSNSIAALRQFADRYRNTAYAALAEERIVSLSAPIAASKAQPQASHPKPSWCSQAGTQTERAICADAALSAYDARINQAYRYWRNELSGEAKRQFDAIQFQWLSSRDSCGADRRCIENAYLVRLGQIAN